MLFCNSLKTTFATWDVYAIIEQCFTENGIPITNLISNTAGGAPVLMGKQNGIFKLMKNDNSLMMAVYCIIHRKNLVAAAISSELDLVWKKLLR